MFRNRKSDLRLTLKVLFKSALFRLMFLVLIIIVPINIFTLFYTSRALTIAENQVASDVEYALSLNIAQIDTYTVNVSRRLFTVSRENSDYSLVLTKGNDPGEITNVMQGYVRLSSEFSNIKAEYAWLDNVFAYFENQDFLVTAKGYQLPDEKELILEAIEKNQETESNQWKVFSDNALVIVSKYNSSYYGAWIDLDTLLTHLNIDSSENIIAFAGENGFIISDNPQLSGISVDTGNKTIVVNNKKYIITKSESEKSNLVLVNLISREQMEKALPGIINVMLYISIVFFALILILLICLSIWMIRPILVLTNAMNEVDKGNLDYRISSKIKSYEFRLINDQFNKMMESVKELKIDVYENEIEKREIKLQYLSQQIQPHFILNALNIVYSYEPDEYELIMKMVLCLSKYFRFVVNANRPYVKVKNEFEHIRNYLEIQKLRYVNKIDFSVESDEESAEALMPPLLIQNLVENVIKYALRDTETVNIYVNSKCENGFVEINIIDTGYGITEEILEQIKQFKETNMRQEGLGVGIQNTIERLKLFFGEEADFTARRLSEKMGTEVILRFPKRIEEE